MAIRKKQNAEQLVRNIVDGMQELKAHDIVVMDLRHINGAVADYYVVCHGTSTTQTEAIARSVEKMTFAQSGEHPWHMEGARNAQWILMDYINVVVHVFEQSARNYYGIEELWADAEVKKVG